MPVTAKNPRFAKLRRHIADWVLGGQTVLFVSAEQHELIKQQRFLDLDDESLGKQFRRWCQIINEAGKNRADEEGRSFRFVMIAQTVLFLAGELRRFNAETADYVVRGTVDGGETQGCYRVTVEQVADDYEFGEAPVEITHAPDEPDKITKVVLREQNPGYDAWLAAKQPEVSDNTAAA